MAVNQEVIYLAYLFLQLRLRVGIGVQYVLPKSGDVRFLHPQGRNLHRAPNPMIVRPPAWTKSLCTTQVLEVCLLH